MTDKPVTIIVTGRNSETTIRPCLESLAAQEYPIDRILVFDNRSTDSSRDIIREVAAKSPVPIELVDGGERGNISTSYNRGVDMSEAEIVVLCHSDGMIPTRDELRKLVTPLLENPDAVTVYPKMLMPAEVWERFPFWEKMQFVKAVGATGNARCAIFDAVRREAYLKVGGFDAARFTTTCGFGGEDSDMSRRLRKVGRLLDTDAAAVHLHASPPTYPFGAYLGTRAMLGRTYGKVLQHQRGLIELHNLLLLVRPVLALLPLLSIPAFLLSRPLGWAVLLASLGLQLLFAFLNGRAMFRSPSVRKDPRVLLVLPVQWLMIYYESYWFFHGLLTPPRK